MTSEQRAHRTQQRKLLREGLRVVTDLVFATDSYLGRKEALQRATKWREAVETELTVKKKELK